MREVCRDKAVVLERLRKAFPEIDFYDHAAVDWYNWSRKGPPRPYGSGPDGMMVHMPAPFTLRFADLDKLADAFGNERLNFRMTPHFHRTPDYSDLTPGDSSTYSTFYVESVFPEGE